jgi:hypothetical protein
MKLRMPLQIEPHKHHCLCRGVELIRQRSRKWLWSTLAFMLTNVIGIGLDELLKWLWHIISSLF